MALAEIRYTQNQIHDRVHDLAAELCTNLEGQRPLLVSVLKGSVIFLADLVRHMGQIGMDVDVDFMSISAYGAESEPSGVVRIVKDLEQPLDGRHVIVVEDIVDTGLSVSYLLRALTARNPRTLRVCALIDKAVRRITDLEVDYAGFICEEFLIGYGLDFQGRYRNLPCLIAVKDVAAVAIEPGALERLFEKGHGCNE